MHTSYGRKGGREEETSIQITGLSILIIPRGYELIKLRQFIAYTSTNQSQDRQMLLFHVQDILILHTYL